MRFVGRSCQRDYRHRRASTCLDVLRLDALRLDALRFYGWRFEYFERCLTIPNHDCAALLMCCTQMFWALTLLHMRVCCGVRSVAGTRLGMAVFRRTLTPTPLPTGEGLIPSPAGRRWRGAPDEGAGEASYSHATASTITPPRQLAAHDVHAPHSPSVPAPAARCPNPGSRR